MDINQLRTEVVSPAIDTIINDVCVLSRFAKITQLEELAARIKKFPLVYPNADDLLKRIIVEIQNLR